jgi:uncharacterized protein YecA (UPF0149 family)
MQSFDMPAEKFDELAKSHNLLMARQIGNRVIGSEVFTGHQARAVHEAMDARKREIEAVGGTIIHRTAIGRNSPCPCGSGRKFKKCCVDKAARAE